MQETDGSALYLKQGPLKQHGVQITPVQQMISSGTGAILTSILVTPLDVVKIRLQAQKKPNSFSKGKCFLYCNGLMDHMCTCLNGQLPPSQQWYKKPLPAQFNGTLDTFVKIVRYEGITSLWSGLPPTMMMAVPATVVYFTMYEKIKAALMYHDRQPSDWWKPMASGATARVLAATMISPLEMIRTKMQSEPLTYKAIATAIHRAIQTNGVVSLWKGLGPTLLRDVPFSAFYWLCYESMKAEVLRVKGSPELTFWQSFSAGAGAGTMASVLTLPFDVIKTRQQVDLEKASSSTWIMIRKLYATEGIHALFAGLVPRIVKVAPACAIMISTYEYFKTFFYKRNHSQCDLEATSEKPICKRA